MREFFTGLPGAVSLPRQVAGEEKMAGAKQPRHPSISSIRVPGMSDHDLIDLEGPAADPELRALSPDYAEHYAKEIAATEDVHSPRRAKEHPK